MRLGIVVSALLFWLTVPLSLLHAQHHGHHGHLGLSIGLGYGYLPSYYYGPSYAFAPYGFYASGYTVNGLGPFNFPPVVLGPPFAGAQPMQNMVGNGGGPAMLMQPQPGQFGPGLQVQPGQAQAGPVPAGQAAAALAPAPPQAAPPLPERPLRKPRVSNVEAKARAGKFIDAGDRLFRQQRFREALERYKLAAPLAPDMAEIYMRQGFAESAIGQYETAIRFFRRGLKVQPKWGPGELRLDDLYGADNKLAKGAHFEALAQQLQAAPHDPHLHFVLGLELEFDGQAERATPFLLRASQLSANEDHSLDAFLAAAADSADGPILNGANPGGAGGAAAPADPASAKGPILDL